VPGPSRQSSDGLYSSSIEGARSANPGAVLASLPAERRVVIVGDSFTFGLEVPFESAWGTVLERRLGETVRIVNLGVDGYGVDQAVLRYERDGRPWKPDVAILGFIEHDLIRTLSVYSFVTFPEWGFPFAKPRFALRNGALEQLTDRLEPPREILAAPSLASLPLIDHDPGYRREEWEWRSYDASYALRFLLSVFHRWPATDFTSDVDAIVPLNTALIARFVETARHDGVVPRVVYLPARSDFVQGPHPLRDSTLAALQAAGVSYLDLRSCVAAAGESNAFIPSRPHYSAAGNAAVAQCLLPDVRNALSRN
jgi:hypothetical protein